MRQPPPIMKPALMPTLRDVFWCPRISSKLSVVRVQEAFARKERNHTSQGAFAYMAKHVPAGEGEKIFKGRLVMFRNFFNVNLQGEDELITDGAYLHTRGLTGRNATEFTEILQGILKKIKPSRRNPTWR